MPSSIDVAVYFLSKVTLSARVAAAEVWMLEYFLHPSRWIEPPLLFCCRSKGRLQSVHRARFAVLPNLNLSWAARTQTTITINFIASKDVSRLGL